MGWCCIAHIGLIIAVYITFKFFHKANIEKKSVFETGNYNPAKIFVVFFIIFFIFIFTKGIDVLTTSNSYSIEYDGPVKSTIRKNKRIRKIRFLMCGRFAQTNIIKATSDIVKTVIGKVDNIDNFNISPGQEAAVIKKYSNGRALELIIGVFSKLG